MSIKRFEVKIKNSITQNNAKLNKLLLKDNSSKIDNILNSTPKIFEKFIEAKRLLSTNKNIEKTILASKNQINLNEKNNFNSKLKSKLNLENLGSDDMTKIKIPTLKINPKELNDRFFGIIGLEKNSISSNHEKDFTRDILFGERNYNRESAHLIRKIDAKIEADKDLTKQMKLLSNAQIDFNSKLSIIKDVTCTYNLELKTKNVSSLKLHEEISSLKELLVDLKLDLVIMEIETDKNKNKFKELKKLEREIGHYIELTKNHREIPINKIEELDDAVNKANNFLKEVKK